MATSLVQNEAGQRFELVTDDEIQLHPQGRPAEVRLPERPVWEVSRVLVSLVPGAAPAGIATGYEVTRWGRVRGPFGDLSGGILPGVINAPTVETEAAPLVVVTYTHGYALTPEDVPDPNPLGIELLPEDVKTVCLRVAKRLFTGQDNDEEVSQTIVSYSYRRATSGALTPKDSKVLARYRITASAA